MNIYFKYTWNTWTNSLIPNNQPFEELLIPCLLDLCYEFCILRKPYNSDEKKPFFVSPLYRHFIQMRLQGWTCVFEGQLLLRVVLTKVSGFGIMLISVVNLPNSSPRKFYQYRYILMVGLPYPITFLVCNNCCCGDFSATSSIFMCTTLRRSSVHV
jgi:hypothetical protein